jgi:hypothetical protein
METKERERFLDEIALTQDESDFNMEAETEEDYAERERRAKNAATVRKMLPGTFWIGSDRVRADRKLTGAQKKAILTFIKNHPTQMRHLYTELTGNAEYKGYAAGEVNDRPYITKVMKDFEEMSYGEQMKLAAKIESEDIRKRSGGASAAELKAVFTATDAKIAEAKKEAKEAKAALSEALSAAAA